MANGFADYRAALFDDSKKDSNGNRVLRRFGYNMVTYNGEEYWEPVDARAEAKAGPRASGCAINEIRIIRNSTGFVDGDKKYGGAFGRVDPSAYPEV